MAWYVVLPGCSLDEALQDEWSELNFTDVWQTELINSASEVLQL